MSFPIKYKKRDEGEETELIEKVLYKGVGKIIQEWSDARSFGSLLGNRISQEDWVWEAAEENRLGSFGMLVRFMEVTTYYFQVYISIEKIEESFIKGINGLKREEPDALERLRRESARDEAEAKEEENKELEEFGKAVAERLEAEGEGSTPVGFAIIAFVNTACELLEKYQNNGNDTGLRKFIQDFKKDIAEEKERVKEAGMDYAAYSTALSWLTDFYTVYVSSAIRKMSEALEAGEEAYASKKLKKAVHSIGEVLESRKRKQ